MLTLDFINERDLALFNVSKLSDPISHFVY
jgi:hypothetical protein